MGYKSGEHGMYGENWDMTLWGLASGLFARGRHLTRNRPLAGAAATKSRGQACFTHSLLIQSAGQADVSVLPPQSKPRGCHHVQHSITIHLSQCTALCFINNKASRSINVELFMYHRPDGS